VKQVTPTARVEVVHPDKAQVCWISNVQYSMSKAEGKPPVWLRVGFSVEFGAAVYTKVREEDTSVLDIPCSKLDIRNL